MSALEVRVVEEEVFQELVVVLAVA